MSERRITQIPVAGSSGRTPTGAMQFGQDWPGLFIRGDEAMAVILALKHVDHILRERCKLGLPHELERLIEIIERDVIVPKG